MKHKAKILAELVKKFPGLSKQILGLIADKLAGKVTEETEIEGAITELEASPISVQDYADFLQKETDRRVTEATNKVKTDPPKPSVEKTTEDENDPLTKILGAVSALADKVNNMERQGTQKTLTEQLQAKLTEKKIPLKFAKGRSIEKLEDLETTVSDIETDYTEFMQDLHNEGFSQTSKPAGGAGGGGNEKVDADILAFAKKQTDSVNPQKP